MLTRINRLTAWMRYVFALPLFLAAATVAAPAFPPLDESFEAAQCRTAGETLTVSTGIIERTWRWTGNGLSTVSLKDLRTGKQWVNTPPGDSDWLAEGLVGDSEGTLVSLTAKESDDDGFTTRHLRVVAEVLYPATGTAVREEISVYPGSAGLRSQLWVARAGEVKAQTKATPAVSFTVLAGKPFLPKEALKVAPRWHAESLQDTQQVKLRINGVESDQVLHLGISWWDYGNGGRTQSLSVSSIDGEAREILIEPSVLPGWKRDKQPAASRIIPLPGHVNLDGTVILTVDNHKGPSAVLSEAWLYGSGPAPTLDLPPARRAELDAAAPPGTRLIAYLSAGSISKKSNATPAPVSTFLPVTASEMRAIGYFNDTQNRHNSDTPLIREEIVEPGTIDWASIICLEAPDGGLALVKESHKCVNQSGVDTGAFIAGPEGVAVTGWGLPVDKIGPEFRWCWANWTILYPEPSADARELAIKRFDRTRYPLKLDRDVYLKANTWGSGIDQPASFAMAREDEVLAEIDSVADLGLDALQIDDGWQVGRMKGKHPELREWRPRPDWYPDGWKNVLARAREKHIDLGIWFAARAPLEDLTWSYDKAGFNTYKLDFANLGQYDGVESYLAKGRALVSHSGHRAKVNWDVTEIAPRFGYFWARECGSIWLANRKPMQPDNVVPRPWLMLREAWQLARYLNTSKFELPIQNFQRVNRKISDAHQHSETYSTALGLAGIPVFFQTTRLLEADQRAEIKALLKPYREVRSELFTSYVFPIGDEPDNASWTGFQWIDPDSDTGFLLVFRELRNKESSHSMPLRFLPPGSPLEVKNLRDGDSFTADLGDNSSLPLTLPQAGDVLFLRYRVR